MKKEIIIKRSQFEKLVEHIASTKKIIKEAPEDVGDNTGTPAAEIQAPKEIDIDLFFTDNHFVGTNIPGFDKIQEFASQYALWFANGGNRNRTPISIGTVGVASIDKKSIPVAQKYGIEAAEVVNEYFAKYRAAWILYYTLRTIKQEIKKQKGFEDWPGFGTSINKNTIAMGFSVNEGGDASQKCQLKIIYGNNLQGNKMSSIISGIVRNRPKKQVGKYLMNTTGLITKKEDFFADEEIVKIIQDIFRNEYNAFANVALSQLNFSMS